MVTMKKRARALETPPNPNHHQQQINEDDHTQKICDYEQSREKRIKENLERMQKLGIFDLSLKFKAKPTLKNKVLSSNRKTPQHLSALPPPGPVRRSSRLHNVTPVSYSEVEAKNDGADKKLVREGSKLEVYTEEHEKLLGDTNMSWTLFVDGYGNDGKRIYDPIKGKTCHQCRQKTLGHRTQCCECNMVQGQFCGDCLYMRYGENVLEAKQNPNWICPVCRGICNCSLCRTAKGWPPTGTLYKKITNLGFKSVAHYLIQTRCSDVDLDKSLGTKTSVSAKRSLNFSDGEALITEDTSNSNTDDEVKDKKKEEMMKLIKDDDNAVNKHSENNFPEDKDKAPAATEHRDGSIAPEVLISEMEAFNEKESVDSSNKTDDVLKGKKKDEIMKLLVNKQYESNGAEDEEKPLNGTEQMDEQHIDGSVAPQSGPEPVKVVADIVDSEYKTDEDEFRGNNEHDMPFSDDKQCNNKIIPESSSTSETKTPLSTEPVPDGIAGRLRQRRGKGFGHDKLEFKGDEETLDAKQQAAKSGISETKVDANMKCPSSASPQVDSIAGRLRSRCQKA